MGIGLKVPVRDAEKVKRKLLEIDAFQKGMKVKHRGDFVIFPLKREVRLGERYRVVPEEFAEIERKGFEDCLRGFLDAEELRKVHRSFDIIGDIAIIEVPDELERHEKRIAECLASAHKNVKGVFKKAGAVKGELRTRELKHLWGRRNTTTLHREHGCLFKVDVAGVYFSPRLAYERQRILQQVTDGEVIVDFFAGVGPFSILLAKKRDVKVYAIDSNPRAYELLKENILLNRVTDRVIPLLGDCRQVSPRGVSRAVMNLPLHSHEYLDLAFDVVKRGVIHFYTVSREDDLYGSKVRLVLETAKEKNRKATILNRRVVRPYAPRRYHVVLDVKVEERT
jgi:tRNA (guanine37-N1)-methyltransferase